jgi:hypothetical protein
MGDMGSRLIALGIFSPATGLGDIFFLLWHGVWSWQLFVYGQLLWVDVYPSSLLPISCVSTTS